VQVSLTSHSPAVKSLNSFQNGEGTFSLFDPNRKKKKKKKKCPFFLKKLGQQVFEVIIKTVSLGD